MFLTAIAFISFAFALCLENGEAAAPQESNPNDGFVSLFNGKDLTGWDGDPRLWSVKDGVIHGETTPEEKANRNTFLIWQGGDVADFELKLSFRCNATNNSGIQYRSRHITDKSAANRWVVRGYQHEVRNENTPPNVPGFIYDEGGKRGRICLAGEKAFWNEDGKFLSEKFLTDDQIKALVRLDDWNDVRIVARGQRLQHFLNGTKILDCTDAHPKLSLSSGVIALQLHAGKPMWTEFKDIFLRKFDAGDKSDDSNVKAPFTADWESLSKHRQAPQWFADAKLGIYFHWGVYSVPAFASEWYPRLMHLPGGRVYKHHVKTYGEPAVFPYHNFVPEFKAEKFDAAQWADLFQEAGARFAGPVAQHHDGFAMWGSDVNPWNAGDRGPKKDITGLLNTELRKRGMKLITTFHHARLLQRNADDKEDWDGFDSHYPYRPDWATSSTDPVISKLYGNMPADEFHQYWGDQVKEVIDKYSPDMIWFDSWLNFIPEKYRKDLAAYYFNDAMKKNKEVAIGYKQADFPSSVGVLDIEQGGKKDVSESVWMTDVTICSGWSYTQGQKVKEAALVVRNMIDVWSKNGVVLLNCSPKSDGTIPAEQQSLLREIGGWLKTHGEAVYGTHPHIIYGWGSAKAQDGLHGGQSATTPFNADDVRLTVAKDNKSMYLFFLGKPTPGKRMQLRHLGRHRYCPPTPITRISVLGSDQEVKFEQETAELYITIPDGPLNELATVLKFELQ